MIRRQFSALLATIFAGSAAPGFAQQSPSQSTHLPQIPSAADAPIAVSASITTRAREWLRRVQLGNIDRSQLDPNLSAIMPDETVRGGAQLTAALGDPNTLVPVKTITTADGTSYFYRANFRSGPMTWVIAIDNVSKINRLILRSSAHDALFSMQVRSVSET